MNEHNGHDAHCGISCAPAPGASAQRPGIEFAVRPVSDTSHSSLDSRHLLARTPIAAMHVDAPGADATLIQ
jgi:hypothetical protein